MIAPPPRATSLNPEEHARTIREALSCGRAPAGAAFGAIGAWCWRRRVPAATEVRP
jgi:hypothetical protein